MQRHIRILGVGVLVAFGSQYLIRNVAHGVTPEVEEGEFEGRQILYKQFQGNVREMKARFTEVDNDAKDILGKEAKDLPTIGIYYDSPRLKGDKMRCVYGVVVPESLKENTDFLAHFDKSGYESAELPTAKGWKCHWEVSSPISYMVGASKCNKAMFGAMEEVYTPPKKLTSDGERLVYHESLDKASVEVYQGTDANYFLPRDNDKAFHLSKFDKEPLRKEWERYR